MGPLARQPSHLGHGAAESGACDEVIMSIAGYVSRAMLSSYSHVRMEAKRRALDEIATRQRAADEKRKPECAVIRGTKNRQRIRPPRQTPRVIEIGRASCRER